MILLTNIQLHLWFKVLPYLIYFNKVIKIPAEAEKFNMKLNFPHKMN